MAEDSPVNNAGNKNPNQVPPTSYANVARIQHTPVEFAIDFGVIAPENPAMVSIQHRVVMSPQHAKALFKALGENLMKYEEKFGQINFPGDIKDIDEFLKRFGYK
jgi:hypothetical protein